MSTSIAPVQTRSERFTSAAHADFAPVTGIEADWKLAPVRQLGDLLDGPLNGERTPLRFDDVDGVSIVWVPRADATVGIAGLPEDRAAANAWTSTDDVLEVTVDGEIAAPVHLERSGLGSTPRAAHTLIRARRGSRATLVISSSGAARLSENVEIVVEDGADLTVVSVLEWADDAVHLGAHFSVVGSRSTLKHIIVSLGGAIIRVNPAARLAGEGADGELLGLSFADAGQHIEHRVFLHHEGRNTRGRVTYKSALQGAKAHTVWIGDVLIGANAVGTDSYEQNRNLVLTEGARADSVPNLEIETGEIAGAGHASATGRFDDEQLFYLQARGIPEEEARRLVVLGFLAEIIQRIGDAPLEERLRAAVEAELTIGTPIAGEDAR
jgi:Fe-S cluster assembly protein SufD